MHDEIDRHSKAFDAELITDPDELAAAEARNGLRQFDAVVEMVEAFLRPGYQFRLRLSHLLHLHRIALQGISAYAGNFRPADIEIAGSKHKPVGAHQVPELIEDMCDYINSNWHQTSPIHLAAYVLWRLNWIHPFTDGNGRTARALSYLVLCSRLGYVLPGSTTIPEQIAHDKGPYYKALEAADLRNREGNLDLGVLEQLLSGLLASQLLSIHKAATTPHESGDDPSDVRTFH
jgi:Fic family protein